MKKRFTDADKWSDPDFRKFKLTTKLLWFWLLDNCDVAGVLKLDLALASFQVSEEITLDDLAALGGRVEKLDNGAYWISGFIKFQYGTIGTESNIHKSIHKSLKRNNVPMTRVPMKACQTPEQALVNTSPRVKDKDKDKDKDGEAKKPNTYPEDFEAFWQQCPTKKSKAHALKAWKKAKRTTSVEAIMAALPAFLDHEADRESKNPETFQGKHPASWLNGECWLDEATPKKANSTSRPWIEPQRRISEPTGDWRQFITEKWPVPASTPWVELNRMQQEALSDLVGEAAV